MFTYLSAEVREGLERARQKASPRSRRLALHLGDDVYPIRRVWNDGFAIELGRVNRLRGHVEIHEGSRHILTCLIAATDVQDDELICHFKRVSPVLDRAPLDYEVEEELPILLSKR